MHCLPSWPFSMSWCQLPGRSGYLACFVVLALALFWMAPARGRLPAMLAPFLLMGIAYAFSPQIHNVWRRSKPRLPATHMAMS